MAEEDPHQTKAGLSEVVASQNVSQPNVCRQPSITRRLQGRKQTIADNNEIERTGVDVPLFVQKVLAVIRNSRRPIGVPRL